MSAVEGQHTILVTGAGGFIGSALLRSFAAHGWRAIGAGRRRPAELPPQTPWREYDLSWTALPDDFFDGADVLVHAAMIRGDVATNVAGSTLLLDRAQQRGVKQIVFLSSLAAHEGALSQYGRQKYVLEQLFNARGALVIRPGLVLGDGGAFGAMCAYLRKHRFVPLIGGGAQPLQTVAIDELVGAIYDGVERNVRGTYTVATVEPVTIRAFYESVCKQLGVRVTFVPIPFWLADLALRTAAMLHVALPIDRDNLLGLKAMRIDTGPRLAT
ncbi:MAG TPA: NAD-dependent epimerase/dehydratase family protein [Candidatus Baltobacteraceae bacterium]|nr:NAD-dependent epimerase/dehydratase family protein [Candidatus Baltobacteraceae bacterium]